MANEEKAEKAKLRYSQQAATLLAQMKDDFPINEFEEFVVKNFFVVGGGYIIDFLQYKKAQTSKKS